MSSSARAPSASSAMAYGSANRLVRNTPYGHWPSTLNTTSTASGDSTNSAASRRRTRANAAPSAAPTSATATTASCGGFHHIDTSNGSANSSMLLFVNHD